MMQVPTPVRLPSGEPCLRPYVVCCFCSCRHARAEVQEPALEVALAVTADGGQAEGAADRVHPHVAAVHGDVPLGTGADEVAVAGEEQEGPVAAALALQQSAEDREGLAGTHCRP